MGTNFYWAGENVRYSTDPLIHIGKRSAAGMYCWDCGVTLCKGGEDDIHSGSSRLYRRGDENGTYYVRNDWYDECPKCGQKRGTEGINQGVAVELGFAIPRTERPTGVQGCSSFSWAQVPLVVHTKCLHGLNRWRKIVVDEYGRKYTGGQFIKMLDMNCPVQYTRHVGVKFS